MTMPFTLQVIFLSLSKPVPFLLPHLGNIYFRRDEKGGGKERFNLFLIMLEIIKSLAYTHPCPATDVFQIVTSMSFPPPPLNVPKLTGH